MAAIDTCGGCGALVGEFHYPACTKNGKAAEGTRYEGRPRWKRQMTCADCGKEKKDGVAGWYVSKYPQFTRCPDCYAQVGRTPQAATGVAEKKNPQVGDMVYLPSLSPEEREQRTRDLKAAMAAIERNLYCREKPTPETVIPNQDLGDGFQLGVTPIITTRWTEFSLIIDEQTIEGAEDEQAFRRLLSAKIQAFGDRIMETYRKQRGGK